MIYHTYKPLNTGQLDQIDKYLALGVQIFREKGKCFSEFSTGGPHQDVELFFR